MKLSYLEVTYRKGRAIAAYYNLPRQDGDHSVRTEQFGGGLIVDFTTDGRAIGIEITEPSQFSLATLNDVLQRLGFEPVRGDEFAPLAVA